MIFKILIFGIAAYALYRLFMNDKRKNIEKSENDEAKFWCATRFAVFMWRKKTAFPCGTEMLWNIFAVTTADRSISNKFRNSKKSKNSCIFYNAVIKVLFVLHASLTSLL